MNHPGTRISFSEPEVEFLDGDARPFRAREKVPVQRHTLGGKRQQQPEPVTKTDQVCWCFVTFWDE